MSSEEDVAGEHVMDALVQATFQVTGVLSRVGAENDLSLTQLRVFGILRDRRPRVTELAAHLGLDKSTISGLIDRAEKRGFLARARSADDRRAVEVFLTPDGHAVTERLYDEIRRELEPMLAGLDAEQRTQLGGLLRLTLAA
jgi:DNA-binding MarR family transcriptional regulator